MRLQPNKIMTYNPITELFSNFFNKKITLSDVEPAAGEDHIIATTFRILADIKNYYEKMAASSRMTLQGAIIQVLGNLMDQHITITRLPWLSVCWSIVFLKSLACME